MRKPWIFVIFGAIGLVWIGIFVLMAWSRDRAASGPSAETVADQFSKTPAGNDLPILWDAPQFSYSDQDGKTFTDADVRGHVWVADFFFTQCTTICPMMTKHLSDLQSAITNASVQFVSFSVDPEHDTPAVLKAYATMWRADESRWHFLSTTPEALAETAAGMRTFVHPPEKDQPIQHSAIFLLVDAQGHVRGVYDSSDPLALRRLTYDALSLAGTPPTTRPDSGSSWEVADSARESSSPGETLYATRGCVACHAQGRVAPALKDRFGRAVLLDDGTTVMEDEAYVRESILDPNARVVAGYPKLMPSYRGQLTNAEVDQLVQYIKSIGGDPAKELLVATTAPADSGKAIDPVCGMKVDRDSPDTLHETVAGKTYYFCSKSCRNAFLKKTKTAASQPATKPAESGVGVSPAR